MPLIERRLGVYKVLGLSARRDFSTAPPTGRGQRALHEGSALVADVLQPADRVARRGELFALHIPNSAPETHRPTLRNHTGNAQILGK